MCQLLYPVCYVFIHLHIIWYDNRFDSTSHQEREKPCALSQKQDPHTMKLARGGCSSGMIWLIAGISFTVLQDGVQGSEIIHLGDFS